MLRPSTRPNVEATNRKLVHYCWFGGSAKPPAVIRCLESWARHLPGYEIREWNESNCSLESSYLKTAYERGLWSKVSNLIRLQALLQHGGIYLDTDIEVFRAFDDLLEEECVVGFQHEQHERDWVNNAVIVSRPHHPFLKACIELTLDHFETTGEFLRSPSVTTAVLKEWGLVKYGTQRVKDVLVLETGSFYPVSYREAQDPVKVSASSYCTHHWHFTWKGNAAGKPDQRMERGVASAVRSLTRHVSGALVNVIFLEKGESAPLFRRCLETSLAMFRRPLAELAHWRIYRLPRLKRQIRRRFTRESTGLRGPQLLADRSSGRVLKGPFAEMRLLSGEISQLTPKLLGTYEQELHPWIDWIIERNYKHFINIGCAEGYYAVGLAVRCPEARGYAFDIALRARRATSKLAALNGVTSRIRIGARCTSRILARLPTQDAIVLCDIEGAEDELLDPQVSSSLLERDLLVEIHDGPGVERIKALLARRFAQSHECELVSYRGRSSRDAEEFSTQLTVFERQALVEEYRLHGIEWMLLRRKSAALHSIPVLEAQRRLR